MITLICSLRFPEQNTLAGNVVLALTLCSRPIQRIGHSALAVPGDSAKPHDVPAMLTKAGVEQKPRGVKQGREADLHIGPADPAIGESLPNEEL
ncbi:hypothetical protein [Labrys neptuniae]|uniref:hypothetical protein n=1 Tax=Labrys TaxID=204476 RepID=UPI00373FD69A